MLYSSQSELFWGINASPWLRSSKITHTMEIFLKTPYWCIGRLLENSEYNDDVRVVDTNGRMHFSYRTRFSQLEVVIPT